MIKAVAICGSRHEAGGTERLLKRCMERLVRSGIEGRLISLHWKKVEPCSNCDACRTTRDGYCAIESDDFASLFKVIREADVILIGAPVDLGAAPSDLKHFLERSLRLARANGNLLARKIGVPVPVLAQTVSRHSLQRLVDWFPAQGMVMPGAASLPMVKGAVQLAVRPDREGEAVMDELADNLAWLAGKLA